MRRVLHADVTAAACALCALPAAARAAALAAMLGEADLAWQFQRDNARPHPRLGNGSLSDVALMRPHVREPLLDTPDYAACMAMVYQALAGRGGTLQPRAQDMQVATAGSSARRPGAIASPHSLQ